MQEIYRIGCAEVRPAERAVLVEGEEAVLGSRAFDLLLVLIAHHDRLLTKQELLNRVWPGLVVEENNLSVQVSTLRKVLGAKAIATIPGRGYRLSALVDRVGGSGSSPAPVVAPVAPATNAYVWRGSTAIAADRPPLLGRDGELAELCRLAAEHRLVTVVGTGGIGKTSLAIAGARALSNSFADGVWLIELVGLRLPADLASQTAQAMGIQLPGTRPALDELRERLRDQSACLVLDNCEHVIDEAATFVKALQHGTCRAHVIATSQEPLRLGTEHLLRVGALHIPANGTPAGEASEVGAVALFRERVRAANPAFDIDDGNISTVINICRELDGSPLAIELAAGRVGLLGVAGVHGHLSGRFRLLASSQRDRDARHRTLQATLDWSYALLSESEQRIFRWLGVMVGGFGLELAEQVAGTEAAGADAWLEALATLVDRSLVVVEGDARPRYRLLESARAYALDKLAEHGELAALRARHAKGLLRALRANLVVPEAQRVTDDEWTMTFGAEVDNLRAAIEWARGSDGDAALALDLLTVASTLMYQLGRFSEALQWFQAGRALLGPGTPDLARAGFESGLAVVGLYALPYDERMALLESASRVFAQHGHHGRLVGVHCMMAFISAVAGQYTKAQHHLDVCAPLFAQLPSLAAVRARWLFPSAVVHLGQGEADAALACIERAIPLAQAAGDSRTAAYLHTNRGVALHAAGRLDEAERCLLAFLDAGGTIRSKFNMASSEAFAHSYLIRLDVERGAIDRATVRLREALPLMQRATGAGQFAGTLAYLVAAQGRLRDAALLQGADIAGRRHRGEATPWLEQKVAAAVHSRVLERHGESVLASWYAEGARLEEAAIAALARGD
jgi:predicted ATPase/DNA-binding winged helix-turn-helix (wHTH) protein